MTWAELWGLAHATLVGMIKRPGTVGLTADLGTGYNRAMEEEQQRLAVVEFARTQLGKPYKLGVEVEPGSEDEAHAWDCSEIVQLAFSHAGLTIPDGSPFQFDFCHPIKTEAAKPGDLGFLWSDKWGRIGHVWVYTGLGTVIHAVGGRGVVEDPAHQWGVNARFRGVRRFPDWAVAMEERQA